MWDIALQFQKTSGHLIIVTHSGQGIAIGRKKKKKKEAGVGVEVVLNSRKAIVLPSKISITRGLGGTWPLSVAIPQAKTYRHNSIHAAHTRAQQILIFKGASSPSSLRA